MDLDKWMDEFSCPHSTTKHILKVRTPKLPNSRKAASTQSPPVSTHTRGATQTQAHISNPKLSQQQLIWRAKTKPKLKSKVQFCKSTSCPTQTFEVPNPNSKARSKPHSAKKDQSKLKLKIILRQNQVQTQIETY
jgi:prophage antirepressor-like protein